VQYVTKNDLSALMMALHKISQRQLPLLLFGAGLPQLARLAGEAKSYAERLFDFLEIDRLDANSARVALAEPAKRESVVYEDDALDIILEETEGYPFFLQVWGSCAWEVAPSSPITAAHVKTATKRAVEALDKGFFKVRIDRLTDRQQQYARAMAELGPSPANSTAVAKVLGMTVKQAAPIRDEVIKKGVAYSPSRGLVSFTVPKFDEFMKRTIPGKGSKRHINK
jgi:cysteinyl-tRNA synthetase